MWITHLGSIGPQMPEKIANRQTDGQIQIIVWFIVVLEDAIRLIHPSQNVLHSWVPFFWLLLVLETTMSFISNEHDSEYLLRVVSDADEAEGYSQLLQYHFRLNSSAFLNTSDVFIWLLHCIWSGTHASNGLLFIFSYSYYIRQKYSGIIIW